jgi:hypothetical protein
MATKTYIKTGAIYRSVVIRVSTDKGDRLVEFGGGGLNLANPNCFFTTADKALQTALEAHEDFNASDGFILLRTIEDAKTEKQGKQDVNEVGEVKSFDDAKKYILKNYKDYTQADVSTPEKVKEVAANLGISFPNWAA